MLNLHQALQYQGYLPAPTGGSKDARRSATTIDGVYKDTIYAPPGPDLPNFVSFSLHLPETPKLRLAFSMGLREGCSQGVTFQVLLNGETRFDYFKNTFNWTEGDVSLGDFAGQPLLLELVTDPAQSGQSGENCDWASWGEPLITHYADANVDGIIDVFDLVILSKQFGNADGDINEDGRTDILDLILVAEQFTR